MRQGEITSIGRSEKAATAHLKLIEGFELRSRGRRVDVAPSCRRVVAYLALHPKPTPRATVAAALWPDTTDDRAAASLRSALWRLHRDHPSPVVADRELLGLDARISVDVRECRRVAAELLAGTADPLTAQFVDLTGTLLPDWYDDWILFERERLHQLQLEALEAVSARFCGQGAHGSAVSAGLAAVTRDPLRESAHRAVIQAHASAGNFADASRQYQLYRGMLARAFGLTPSPALDNLMGALGLPLD